jgi:hypothetical protein
MGACDVKKRSDAFFSAINLRSGLMETLPVSLSLIRVASPAGSVDCAFI